MGGLPILKAAGLQTAHNPFSGVAPGALALARNVVIFSNGVVEPRRGAKQLSYTFSAPNTELSSSGGFFGTSLVFQFDTSSLAYDTGSAFSTYSGTFAPVDDSLLRTKFVEARENLYLNTTTGQQVLSSTTATPRAAGLPTPAIVAYAEVLGGGAFISHNEHLVVRAVYTYEDENGNVITSPPSDRVFATNTSTDSASLSVYHNAPASLPVGTKIQLFGSPVVDDLNVDPGDTLYQFYETGAATADSFDFHTYSLSDVPLYTNARVDGISGAHYPPPICKDMAAFNGRTFYTNTTSSHRFSLTILGTGTPDGVQVGDTITVDNVVFTAVASGDTPAVNEFRVYTSGTVTNNIAKTARDLVRSINGLPNAWGALNTDPGVAVKAFYIPNSDSNPGAIIIEADTLGRDAFSVYASRAASWNPELPTSEVDALHSDNNRLKHGLFYSLPDQPEAVPLLNYLLIGAKNKEILRVIPLRDKLFVFKEDGIYTVAGDEPFTVDLLDGTTRLVAPDTAVSLNNQIYALTNQGVVSVSDAGVQVLSRGVEDALLPYLNAAQRSTIRRTAFAVAHETDRLYELWLPGPGVTDSRVCNTAFVFNTMTQAWTQWDGSERSWGTVDPTDVRYYGATGGKVLKERRDYASSDYADETFAVTVSGYSDTTLTLSSTAGIVVGDALSISKSGTTQSVTITAIPDATTLTVAEPILTDLQSGSTAVVDTAFECEVRWLPVTFEHPASMKRFQYGTLHFTRGTAFYTGYAVYATETASGITTETVAQSTQGWGSQAWGSSPWGDAITNFNMRHVVPLEKQRATGISPGFKIREARKAFKLLGLTLDTEETSARGSK